MRKGLCAISILLSFATFSVGAAESRSATLIVKQMTCAACPVTVKKLLAKVPGVREVAVSLATEQAEVVFDPEKVAPDHLAKLVSDSGFPTVVKK